MCLQFKSIIHSPHLYISLSVRCLRIFINNFFYRSYNCIRVLTNCFIHNFSHAFFWFKRLKVLWILTVTLIIQIIIKILLWHYILTALTSSYFISLVGVIIKSLSYEIINGLSVCVLWKLISYRLVFINWLIHFNFNY